MNIVDESVWREKLPILKEAARKYYAGELSRKDYKGTSGKFGTYAQKADGVSMLRLRMPAGRLTKEKMAFIADSIREYNVDKIKFGTCQTVQLHNLGLDAVCNIMENALDVGIITQGGGGDNPRNVTCSPRSGVEQGEYFDVMPYAEAASQYAMQFIYKQPLPRKYKIAFSNSPKNESHATMRELGFTARPDGKFDVYSAGGACLNPKVGIKVGEAVEPKDILKYVYAMWEVYINYGNYESRAKARSRYIRDAIGGDDKYYELFQKTLAEVEGKDDFTFDVEEWKVTKSGDGEIDHPRAIAQKQPGLYSVVWHPLGGCPDPEVFCQLSDALKDIDEAEVRVALEASAYIVNLTAEEAKKVIEITAGDTAANQFEMTSACIGASICQQGLRDSQALLRSCVEAVREAGLPDGSLPAVHITGCTGYCTTPMVNPIGFRGSVKNKQEAWLLFLHGCDKQDQEVFGKEIGNIFTVDVPKFLVELGQTVATSGKSYFEWLEENPGIVENIASKYI